MTSADFNQLILDEEDFDQYSDFDFDPTEDNDFDPDDRRTEMPWGYSEHFDSYEDDVELPTEVAIRKSQLDEDWDVLAEDEKVELLNDFLSDTYGFLIISYCYEETDDEIQCSDIVWEIDDWDDEEEV